MRTLAPAAAAPDAAPAPVSLEPEVRALGHHIAAEQARAPRGAGRAFEDRGMELLARDPQLRAAVFRLVDVAPACATPRELADHLGALLGEVDRRLPIAAARRPLAGRLAGVAVHRMAQRFIVGQGPRDAVPALARLWRAGAAASVDLLGEATVTAAEADRYTARCDEALRTLAAAARGGPPQPVPAAGGRARVAGSARARAWRRRCAPTREPVGEGERDDAARARRRARAGGRR